jgi:predicted RNA binding protein YcfA (HicA-like mRNA interferase family)
MWTCCERLSSAAPPRCRTDIGHVLPRLSGKAVLQTLRREGYVLVRSRGSHHYLRKPGTAALVVIPVHGNRDLPTGTLRSILRQAGLSPEVFAAMLGRTE